MPVTVCSQPERPAVSLYFGNVMHARLKPVSHRFNYRVMSLLIDLDRLDEADRTSLIFGVNRAALYSFHESDHGPRDGSCLRTYAGNCAAAHGIDLEGGHVLLLCYPRLLGYSFSPLSVYFCYCAGGELALVIYEVRNTCGEMHAYVHPVRPSQITAAGLRQQQRKDFYVSPFMEMGTCYRFRLSAPAEHVKIRILETDAAGPLLAASFCGRRRALSSATLLSALIAIPLIPFKVIAAIHWQALQLWLKGARVIARPTCTG